MTKNINLPTAIATFGIPITLILSMIVLARSALFLRHPEALAMGITFDLVLTVPLVYFLLIRKTDIPKTAIVPFFILGIVVAGWAIPDDYQFYLTQVKHWVLPVVETTVLLLVGYKVTQTVKKYRNEKATTPDFFTAVLTATEGILPKALSRPFATELAVFYYGFLHWKRRKLSANEFSYHKKSSTIALLGVVILLVAAETMAFHLILQRWSALAAWILTGLSIYTAFQLFGFLRAMSKRPITIGADRIELRYGLLGDATVSLDNVEQVLPFKGIVEKDSEVIQLSPLGEMEPPNLIIHLKERQYVYGLYGIKKEGTSIAFFVDEPQHFLETIGQHI